MKVSSVENSLRDSLTGYLANHVGGELRPAVCFVSNAVQMFTLREDEDADALVAAATNQLLTQGGIRIIRLTVTLFRTTGLRQLRILTKCCTTIHQDLTDVRVHAGSGEEGYVWR